MKQNLSFLLLYIVAGILCREGVFSNCPCPDQNDCKYPTTDIGTHKEVFVFSNGATNVQLWNWNTITTLIAPSSFDISNKEQANTMCVSHRNGRKFGITVEMNLTGQISDTSEESKGWIRSVVSKQKSWHAEVITVNLVPYFSSDILSFRDDHIAVVKVLINLKIDLGEAKVACIIPWKPPCAEADTSCDFTSLSNDACDYFIINPDSFTDLDDVKCRARANIPLSKLLYGISEYNSHNIPNNKIILGVPWHGYDYTCETIINNICSLQEAPNANGTRTKCNFSSRKRVSNGDIVTQYQSYYKSRTFDKFYNAPYFNYNNGTENHQIWFEDNKSLFDKYRLVEVHLKGLGVLYGDDLFPSSSSVKMVNDMDMWTWVAHETILSDSQKSLSERLYYTDTFAVTAVGCLVLGAILGVIFTYVGLRVRIKKPRNPFQRDMDTDMEAFTDEDPNL